MLKRLGLVSAISLMIATPALADSGACGSEPIAPAIPSAAEMGQKSPADAQKMKHQAFLDIRQWQGALKDYRGCLDGDVASIKRDRANAASQTKPDQDRINGFDAKIKADQQANDRSADDEERVVNDFNNLSTAFCARADTDKSSCPKS